MAAMVLSIRFPIEHESRRGSVPFEFEFSNPPTRPNPRLVPQWVSSLRDSRGADMTTLNDKRKADGGPPGVGADSPPARTPCPTESMARGWWAEGAGCACRSILRTWRAIGGAVPWACHNSNADGCEVVAGRVGRHKILGGFYGG